MTNANINLSLFIICKCVSIFGDIKVFPSNCEFHLCQYQEHISYNVHIQ